MDSEEVSKLAVGVGATLGAIAGGATAFEGAVTGAAAGAALGPVGAILGGALGALIGGGIGAGIGSLFKSKKKIYVPFITPVTKNFVYEAPNGHKIVADPIFDNQGQGSVEVISRNEKEIKLKITATKG